MDGVVELGTSELSTPEVSVATGLSYRQLDHWISRGVITPAVNRRGSGNHRRWTCEQVRYLMLLSTLRGLGAGIDVLRVAARSIVELEAEEGPTLWGGTILVTEDGRCLRGTACDEHGYLVRLNQCRDLTIDVRRLAALAAVS